MTNPHKGDVPFNVGSRAFTLCYSHSALVKLEAALDRSVFKILDDLQDPQRLRLATIIALLWAGMQRHHPGMTKDDVTDLLDEIDGGTLGAWTFINEAFAKAFGAPGTKGTNPPLNGSGTGTNSLSSMPVTDMLPANSGI
jgi:hypothetical protein